MPVQFAEAVVVYDAILARNPYHAAALGNKALALMNSGNVTESLACFERCVGIDLNMAEPQINQAACLAVTGQAEQATLTLARLLMRYSWSFDHWLALVQMAGTQDTFDLAQRFIEPGLAVLAGVPVGDRVRAAMSEPDALARLPLRAGAGPLAAACAAMGRRPRDARPMQRAVS